MDKAIVGQDGEKQNFIEFYKKEQEERRTLDETVVGKDRNKGEQ